MAKARESTFYGLSQKCEEDICEESWKWKHSAVLDCEYDLHRILPFPKTDKTFIDLSDVSKLLCIHLFKTNFEV